MKALAGWLIVVVLGVGVVACGGESAGERPPQATPDTAPARPPGSAPSSPPPGPPSRPPEAAPAGAAIARLLRARAHALERRDPRAYAATATPDRWRRDARTARQARGVLLRDVELTPRSVRIRGSRAVVVATSSYRLAGLAGRWSARRRIELVESSGDWLVRREQSRIRHPWELAPYRLFRTAHFHVLAPAGIDPEAAGLPAQLESARAGMRDRLAGRLPKRRHLVVVAASPADAKSLTGGIAGVDQLSALTDASVRVSGPAQRVTRVLAVRLLVPWPRFASLSAPTRERVLTHELTHVALTSRTPGRTPAWLQEGIALYVSADARRELAAQALASPNRATAARRSVSLAALSGPDAIARLDGSQLSAAYAYASAAAFYIAERYGERRLLALLRRFGDPALTGGRRGLTDAALRAALGIGLRVFESDLRAWIAAGRRSPG